MPALKNNRDLHTALRTLGKTHTGFQRSLEVYLRAILRRADALRFQDGVARETFYALLTVGFSGEPAPFEESWRSVPDVRPADAATYAGWRATVTRQVAELREMEEAANHMGWGATALAFARNERWHNTTIRAYLDAATDGVFGAVTAHQIGRPFTPSEVVEIGGGSTNTGELEVLPAAPEPPALGWDVLAMFMRCGRRFR